MSDSENHQELLQAVALYYDGESSPVLSAKGSGSIAQEIIDIAKEHDVPLCDNKSLVEFLLTLELGDEIPEKLYIAVAYIIAFAYDLKGFAPGQSTDR
ncbi:EscU/YscU/HrcU family type III secretion system export apparatus switch protein [Gilvimarinus sp. SDUM040013]|uniref:Flagellar biosynthetic protein FlhB n=1 Tax=Gilvimarinus gilvus TaxID=3058038 RepID=A0ABU4S201_9GAMM|nr:EscU/YscU/HrcU family type III secretion system export apparatus switch protein [Gilvimarinus sp. SDUM040013]MDO3385574.1 EscU/YscU/HrcU family type III secretion system export apparatus switch protein [Gilvimarinus sp. SDUM040013]MDX6851175.1 EscU/YscU/HrcU family type III secretion system export apparatus switch protein [Gilvimarinus sp. SDUM040013]